MQGTSDFLKSLAWLALKPVAKNYQIIVISFYLNIIILGVEIARVTRALKRTEYGEDEKTCFIKLFRF